MGINFRFPLTPDQGFMNISFILFICWIFENCLSLKSMGKNWSKIDFWNSIFLYYFLTDGILLGCAAKFQPNWLCTMPYRACRSQVVHPSYLIKWGWKQKFLPNWQNDSYFYKTLVMGRGRPNMHVHKVCSLKLTLELRYNKL